MRLGHPHRFTGLGEREAGAYLRDQDAIGELVEDRAHNFMQAGAKGGRA